VAAERQPYLERVQQMLRSLRQGGLEEGTLRQFVCKQSGDHWEPFYEALFGYDAKMEARERWGRNEHDLPRERYGEWREPLIRGMDALLQRLRRRPQATAEQQQAPPERPASAE
jgi:hypothetical protein